LKVDGKQCSRNASTKKYKNDQYCWQHQKCKKSVSSLQQLQTYPRSAAIETVPAQIEKQPVQKISPQKVQVKEHKKLTYFKKPMPPHKPPTKKPKTQPKFEQQENIEPSSQEKALIFAIEIGLDQHNKDLSKVLDIVKKTGNVDAKNDHGLTALMVATSNNFHKVVDALLYAKADPNLVDGNKLTALHRAATLRDPYITKLLIDHGANINAKDKTGLTPLHKAIIYHNSAVVKLLIDSGADIYAKDVIGRTPLKFAQTYGTPGLTQFIKETLAAKGIK
jgi:hypothetical protein